MGTKTVMITGDNPLTATAIAAEARVNDFPAQANGSLVYRNGQVAGSTLIGQPFDDPKYFWGRLSATSPYPDNAAAVDYPAGRVARVRGQDVTRVNDLIAQHIQGRQFGFQGEERVNVLEIILALDQLQYSDG